jgi:hypothetical protein
LARFVSWARTKADRESPYQALIETSDPNAWPREWVRKFFYNELYSPVYYDRNRIYEFLDFQLKKFQGSRQEYIDFLRKWTQPKMVQTFAREGATTFELWHIDPVNEIIQDWIKKTEIESIENPGGRFETF